MPDPIVPQTDPPAQDPTARFLEERRADSAGYPAGDRLALWTAQRREGWSLATLVQTSNRLRAWHDSGCPGRPANAAGPVGRA